MRFGRSLRGADVPLRPSKKLNRLSAFDYNPKNPAAKNPADSNGNGFLETLGLVVAIQFLFTKAAFLKEADELSVLHSEIIGMPTE